MKRFQLIASAFLVVLGLGLRAQEFPGIEFDQNVHDFGEIERGSKTEYTFEFTNISDAPLKLTQVKASCGCTTPSWTREEIAPGGRGKIAVKYDSNRQGPFNKSVTVSYSGSERPIVLRIKGSVPVSEQAAAAADPYQIKSGSMAFIRAAASVGTVNSDKTSSITFRIKNIGPDALVFDAMGQEMEFEVEALRKLLPPGQVTDIKVTVLGDRFIQAGVFQKRITVKAHQEVSGKEESATLSLTGVINKVMSAEELARAPHIAFEFDNYKGGSVIEGERVEIVFPFTNTGKTDLEIVKVKPSCGCTASAPADKIIKPGESSEIRAVFDSRGRPGTQTKSVTVTSNDPDQKTVVLRFTVQVEKDPFHMGSMAPASGGN